MNSPKPIQTIGAVKAENEKFKVQIKRYEVLKLNLEKETEIQRKFITQLKKYHFVGPQNGPEVIKGPHTP